MPAFAAYFTATWPIRHPIRFTAALAIGRWQKVFAIVLSDWQANVLKSGRSADPKHLAVNIGGIPHLAKNKRDMGHPSFVRESGVPLVNRFSRRLFKAP